MEILIGEYAGFCYGVERAVKIAKKEALNGEIACLGEIVHNQNVIDSLKKKGVKFIDNINECKEKLLIRAHGVPKQIYDIAKERNIKLLDATCPSVLKIHNIVEEYSKNGYYIILTGKKDHPEVIGIESFCGTKYKIISDRDELLDLFKEIENEKNILLISQTTYSIKKFDEIEQLLKEQIGSSVNLEIKKTICASTNNRQIEAEKIAKQVDFMIVIGDKRSSNTNKLYDVSCKYCKNVSFISDSNELDLNKIKQFKKVGVIAGASTPKEDILKVKELLLKL